MKIQITFVLSLLCIAVFAQSVPFGKNATWVYEYDEAGFSGYRKIVYSHDTLIDGEYWQKFSESGVSHVRTGPGPNDVSQGKYSGKTFNKLFLTRNDSVFVKDTKWGTQELTFVYGTGLGGPVAICRMGFWYKLYGYASSKGSSNRV